MGCKAKIYALYKGDDCLAIGTVQEIAKQMRVNPATISFYGAPSYQRRHKTRNHRVLIILED